MMRIDNTPPKRDQLPALHMMPPALGLGLLFGVFNLAAETKAMHVFNFLVASSSRGADRLPGQLLEHSIILIQTKACSPQQSVFQAKLKPVLASD